MENSYLYIKAPGDNSFSVYPATNGTATISSPVAGVYTVYATKTGWIDSDYKYITVNASTTIPNPYCTASSRVYSYEYIEDIRINGISSGQSSGGSSYSDNAGTVITSLGTGQKNVLEVDTFTTSSYLEYVSAWIDFNQDNSFDDDEKIDLGNATFSGSHTFSGQFTVPSDAVVGNTRIRVVMEWNEAPVPCRIFDYGEVEDYSVNINESAIVTTSTTTLPASPVAVSRSFSNATPSVGDTIIVTLTMNISGADGPGVITVPSAIDLIEYVPIGLIVSNISTDGIYFAEDNKIEWIFWALGNPVQDQKITYLVTIPSNVSATTFKFSGTADYGEDVIDISGETILTIPLITTTTTTIPTTTTTITCPYAVCGSDTMEYNNYPQWRFYDPTCTTNQSCFLIGGCSYLYAEYCSSGCSNGTCMALTTTTIPTTTTVPISSESEPNDDFTTANEVYSGAYRTGSTDYYSDRIDYFKIYLNSGSTITATLNGSYVADIDLYLYDSLAYLLDSSTSVTSTEEVSATVGSSGYYYVEVYAYSGSGDYTLTFSVLSGGNITTTTVPPAMSPAITRSMPSTVVPGGLFEVNLDVVPGENPPNAMIIDEYLPPGWEVTGSYPAGTFNSETGDLRWILYGSTLYDRSLTYTVQVPTGAAGSYAITGEFLYSNEGNEITGTTEGNSAIMVGINSTSIAARVNRTLPSLATPGAVFDVQLLMDVDEENAPYSVIVNDYFPTGWTVINSSPEASSIDYSTGEIRWVIYEPDVPVTDMNITYTVELPSDESLGNKTFTGYLRYMEGQSYVTDDIGGDSKVGVYTSPGIVQVSRLLPHLTNFDSCIDVLMELSRNSGDTNAVIIEEHVPSRWFVTSSEPAYDSYDSETGEIRWLLYGAEFRNQTMNYTICTPKTGTADTETFTGKILYTSSGMEVADQISGDKSIDVDISSRIVGIERVLPSLGVIGGNITVQLNWYMNESEDLDALIIKDYLPDGWVLVSSSPEEYNFDSKTGEVKWMLYDGELIDRTITYTVNIPDNETENKIRMFSGEAVYLDKGKQIRDVVGGSRYIMTTTETPIPGDTNGDGHISDFELLTLVSLWADGEASDFDLLTAIDLWAQG